MKPFGCNCSDCPRCNGTVGEQEKEIERLRFLVTQARHELMKKKLITFDEIEKWNV